jgi:prophage maintenance system killer protein
MFSNLRNQNITEDVFPSANANVSTPSSLKLNDILRRYHNTYASNPEALRNAIPLDEMWRFFVDGDKQKYGWPDFEKRESGYLLAMMKAFQNIFNTTDDIESLAKKLHFVATSNVNNTLYDTHNYDHTSNKKRKREYRIEHLVSASLVDKNTTSAGLEELLVTVKKHKSTTDFPVVKIENHIGKNKIEEVWLVPEIVPLILFPAVNNITGVETRSSVNKKNMASGADTARVVKALFANSTKDSGKDTIQKYLRMPNKQILLLHHVNDGKINGSNVTNIMASRMKQYIANYNLSIIEEKTPYENLKLIVSFIQNCERLHPFFDGNTRTFSMLLMNYLLIQNGFPLTIRDNPNCSYAHTLDQLCEDVMKGMEKCLDLAVGVSPYRVQTSDIFKKLNDPEKKYFDKTKTIENNGRALSP